MAQQEQLAETEQQDCRATLMRILNPEVRAAQELAVEMAAMVALAENIRAQQLRLPDKTVFPEVAEELAEIPEQDRNVFLAALAAAQVAVM
jgi:hypothetical protein